MDREVTAIGLWLLGVGGALIGWRLARDVRALPRRIRRVADWIAAVAAVALAIWVATQ